MEDQIVKLAIAAGVSVPAARLLYKKYKENKLKSKYIKNPNNKNKIDDYLPHDLRQDVIDDIIDMNFRGR